MGRLWLLPAHHVTKRLRPADRELVEVRINVPRPRVRGIEDVTTEPGRAARWCVDMVVTDLNDRTNVAPGNPGRDPLALGKHSGV